MFRTVYAYATMPELTGSLRNVIGLCWAFSLGAEYLAADSGLGYLVYQSYLYADMGKMIVLAVLYAVLGIISYNLFKPILYNTLALQSTSRTISGASALDRCSVHVDHLSSIIQPSISNDSGLCCVFDLHLYIECT